MIRVATSQFAAVANPPQGLRSSEETVEELRSVGHHGFPIPTEPSAAAAFQPAEIHLCTALCNIFS